MKNSAWYHKLWRKKLGGLPVKANADAGWKLMQQQLDAHLPSAGTVTGGAAAKPLLGKLIALASYVLPAAAMVGVAAYFAVNSGIKPKKDNLKIKRSAHRIHKGANDSSRLVTDGISKYDTISTSAVLPYMLESKKAEQAVINSTDVKENSNVAWAKSFNGKLANANGTAGGNKKQSYAKPVSTQKEMVASAALSNKNAVGSNKANKPKYGAANYRNSGKYQEMQRSSHDMQVQPERQVSAVKHTNFAGGPSAPLQGESLINYGGHTLPLTTPLTADERYSITDDLLNRRVNALIRLPQQGDINDVVTSAKNSKPANNKAAKNIANNNWVTPAYNYGLQAGLNTGSGHTGLYLGLTANYALSRRWLIDGAVTYNSPKTMSGGFRHPSYYRPDSSAAISLTDSRKVAPVDVLLNIRYRVNNLLSIKGGSVISIAGAQLNAITTLGPVGGFRDTLRHRSTIDSVRNSTAITRIINLGFNGGVSINLKYFSLDAQYLWLPKYKVSNPWGTYSKPASRLQIGVSYWFRKK